MAPGPTATALAVLTGLFAWSAYPRGRAERPSVNLGCSLPPSAAADPPAAREEPASPAAGRTVAGATTKVQDAIAAAVRAVRPEPASSSSAGGGAAAGATARARGATAAEERAALEAKILELESKILESQQVAAEQIMKNICERNEAAASERFASAQYFQARPQERDAVLEIATAAFGAERDQLAAAAATRHVAMHASKHHAVELQARLAAEQEQAAAPAADSAEWQSQLDAARVQLDEKAAAELAGAVDEKAAAAPPAPIRSAACWLASAWAFGAACLVDAVLLLMLRRCRASAAGAPFVAASGGSAHASGGSLAGARLAVGPAARETDGETDSEPDSEPPTSRTARRRRWQPPVAGGAPPREALGEGHQACSPWECERRVRRGLCCCSQKRRRDDLAAGAPPGKGKGKGPPPPPYSPHAARPAAAKGGLGSPPVGARPATGKGGKGRGEAAGASPFGRRVHLAGAGYDTPRGHNVFNELDEDDGWTPRLDFGMISALFNEEAGMGLKNEQATGFQSPRKKKGGTKVLDFNRAQSIAIMLSRLPVTPDELCEQLRRYEFADPRVDLDSISLLMEKLPNRQEVEKLMTHEDEVEELRDVEQKIFPFVRLPKCVVLLRLMTLVKAHSAASSKLLQRCEVLRLASEEVRNSKQLRVILREILKLVNCINHGTMDIGRGTVCCFPVESLSALATFKVRQASGLQVLAFTMRKASSTFLQHLKQGLGHVQQAGKEEIADIKQGVHAFSQELTFAQGQVAQIKESSPERERLAMLVCEVQQEAAELNASLDSAESRVAEAKAYFGANDGESLPTPPEEFFGHFEAFLANFETAWLELDKHPLFKGHFRARASAEATSKRSTMRVKRTQTTPELGGVAKRKSTPFLDLPAACQAGAPQPPGAAEGRKSVPPLDLRAARQAVAEECGAGPLDQSLSPRPRPSPSAPLEEPVLLTGASPSAQPDQDLDVVPDVESEDEESRASASSRAPASDAPVDVEDSEPEEEDDGSHTDGLAEEEDATVCPAEFPPDAPTVAADATVCPAEFPPDDPAPVAAACPEPADAAAAVAREDGGGSPQTAREQGSPQTLKIAREVEESVGGAAAACEGGGGVPQRARARRSPRQVRRSYCHGRLLNGYLSGTPVPIEEILQDAVDKELAEQAALRGGEPATAPSPG